jgi:hypothetical protein
VRNDQNSGISNTLCRCLTKLSARGVGCACACTSSRPFGRLFHDQYMGNGALCACFCCTARWRFKDIESLVMLTKDLNTCASVVVCSRLSVRLLLLCQSLECNKLSVNYCSDSKVNARTTVLNHTGLPPLWNIIQSKNATRGIYGKVALLQH